jgi:hypothetical protein
MYSVRAPDANIKAGIPQVRDKNDRHPEYNIRKRNVAANLNNESFTSDNSSTLPFAFPYITAITEAITIPAKRSLPVILLPEKQSPDTIRENRFILSTGVQWQLPVSFTGMDYYTKGPDGSDQPYRLFIPGVWLTIARNKQQVTATCIPFASTAMPAKDYETGYAPAFDSLSVLARKRMLKTFGLQAGLTYCYEVNSHWSIGGGMQANWWKKGLVLAKPVDDSLGIKPFLYTVHSHQEEKFTSFQFNVVLETAFRLKAWEGILQLSQPLHTTVKGLPARVSLSAGIRYRFYRKNIKQKI